MGAGNLDGQSCFLHRFYLYGWQDNTNLHEILTDIAAKRKPRRGDFANGVLNSSKAELRERLVAKQFDDTEMQ